MDRPNQFDPDLVLDKAKEGPWHRGYEAASIEDLITSTGFNRSLVRQRIQRATGQPDSGQGSIS